MVRIGTQRRSHTHFLFIVFDCLRRTRFNLSPGESSGELLCLQRDDGKGAGESYC